MIVKPYAQRTGPRDPRLRAGVKAEKQIAHYLHRNFANNSEVCVLHGVRLEDREQPEQDGSPGVCQIDHLIVHRWGMFIVESKSVTEEIRIQPDGSGGDQWTRVSRGQEKGMPSPIRQAQRQSEFLRTYLNRHREVLLGRMPLGTRTITKVLWDTDQRGFGAVPIQIVIAVSDQGMVRRLGGWKEPRKPFRVFVTKADEVPDKIGRELARHRKGASTLGIQLTSDYGLWSMQESEAKQVAEFLAERHTDRSPAAPARPTQRPRDPNRSKPPDPDARTAEAACKHCGATDLDARFHFGYYWRCRVCDKTTSMPTVCSSCGTKGSKGKGVKIRKDGKCYFRDCETCGISEPIWVER